jgi:hypothetical protein
MTDKRAALATVAVAAIAAAASIFGAVYAGLGNSKAADLQSRTNAAERQVQEAVGSLQAGSQSEQQSLEQAKFVADQEAHRTELLQTYIPELLHGTDNQQAEARAILFVLFPNDIGDVIKRTQAAVETTRNTGTQDLTEWLKAVQSNQLQALSDEADKLNSSTGEWAIVLGAYESPATAASLASAAEAKGYTPAFVYKRAVDGDPSAQLAYPVVLGYPSESEADSVLLAIRTEPRSAGAFVVNLNKWCPTAEPDPTGPRTTSAAAQTDKHGAAPAPGINRYLKCSGTTAG